MVKSSSKDLAALAERLRAGSLSDVEYEQEVDRLLGTALSPRDATTERAWENSRRPPRQRRP